MKQFIMILIFCCSLASIFGQTRRMNSHQTGRTFAVENRNRTNLPQLQEAERLFRLLDFENALFSVENAIAQDVYSSEAFLMRAKLRNRIGMETEAKEDLRIALRLNPYVADLYGYNGNGGMLNVLEFQPELALRHLSTFQKLNYYYEMMDRKSTINVLENEEIALLENALVKIESEQLSDASNIVEKIMVAFPNSAIAYDLKGVILVKQGDYYSAINAFSKSVTIQPNFAIAWYNFGRTEHMLGNLQNAKIYLDRAIELQEDLTKAYFERAMVLKKLGDKKSALADYDHVIELRGETYLEAFINRGLTKKLMGDFGGALTDLNKGIDEFPNNPELFKNRGNLYLLYGFPMKAIDDYTKAIQLNTNFAEAYFNRGVAHFSIFDNVSGCFDLGKSELLGSAKAKEMRPYFCTGTFN